MVAQFSPETPYKHRAQRHWWPNRAWRNTGYGVAMAGLTVRLGFESYEQLTQGTDYHTALGGIALIGTCAATLVTAGLFETAIAERPSAQTDTGLDIFDEEF